MGRMQRRSRSWRRSIRWRRRWVRTFAFVRTPASSKRSSSRSEAPSASAAPPAHHGGDREPSRSRSVLPSATSRDVRFRPLALVLFAFLVGLALVLLVPRPAQAFGDTGAFDPRVLLTGNQTGPARATAPARWSWELVQRTSAPARLRPTLVRADDPAIVEAPFLYWSGVAEVAPLTSAELTGLRRFFALGGVLLVDDAGPGPAGGQSAFARAARREIARALPDTL